MSESIFLVDENHECLKNKDRIILTRNQNNTVMMYASTITKHTELEQEFVLNEVYKTIRIFCRKHMVPCYASYDDEKISTKLQIINCINEIIFDRLKPLVNEKVLDFALAQAFHTVTTLYLTD